MTNRVMTVLHHNANKSPNDDNSLDEKEKLYYFENHHDLTRIMLSIILKIRLRLNVPIINTFKINIFVLIT
jgi:hypothetical protein